MFSSLTRPDPSLDDFDRFFRDEAVLRRLRGVMHDDARVVFELIVGSDRRAWMLWHGPHGIEVRPPDDERSDCTLRCHGHDLRALLLGELDPRAGFLDGRLDVQGDVGIVLGLRKALREPEKQG